MTDIDDELPDIFKTPAESVPQNSAPQNEVADAAAQVIQQMTGQYLTWTAASVMQIKRLLNDAFSLQGVARTTLIQEDLFRHAHDIKGQGATFGYPLMTDLGTHLCQFIRGTFDYGVDELAIIKADVADMETVLTNKLTGDGGVTGAKIRSRINGVG